MGRNLGLIYSGTSVTGSDLPRWDEPEMEQDNERAYKPLPILFPRAWVRFIRVQHALHKRWKNRENHGQRCLSKNRFTSSLRLIISTKATKARQFLGQISTTIVRPRSD
ncbi:hypothetical protein Nepgr_025292 [Nepenthes gracilis]|uniref:Uncharacterized protein n=1 Tax=Nepenthes gracilis TaxID=150966 RepID=A0AAD3T6L5_NEPGR|nr:hypothetical protein Nepgr_025292 [Nepenthes gracilis]